MAFCCLVYKECHFVSTYVARSSCFRPCDLKVAVFQCFLFLFMANLSFLYSLLGWGGSALGYSFCYSLVICFSCDSVGIPEKALPGLAREG